MAEPEQTVENFHGCYLLRSNSDNKWFRGRTYIGYTVDPNRRHKQHNRGRKHGGACRTNNRGPWQVIVIVYGFMTNIAALQFEWAWQHPEESRRLRHSAEKKSKENALAFRLRIMAKMLAVDPWRRMALTVQWLNSEYQMDFPADLVPESHISVLSGAVRTKRVTAPDTPGNDLSASVPTTEPIVGGAGHKRKIYYCHICQSSIEKPERVTCIVTVCATPFHLTCLAKKFADKEDMLLPIQGSCPACKAVVLWADLIRFKKGHYRDGVVEVQGAQVLAEDVPEDAGAD